MVKSKRYRILGVMSGTSADTIDVGVCDVWRRGNGRIHAHLVAFHEQPFSDTLRSGLNELFRKRVATLGDVSALNFSIGSAFADAVEACLIQHRIRRATVVAIASHGQTVYHNPPSAARESGTVPSTLQIGEPAVIAERTGLPVIHNFRAADVAVGGEGAPLVPFADYHLFGRPGQTIVVVNIGGIANITLLPSSDNLEEVIAFDTGPGNMLMDAIVRNYFLPKRFDVDGEIARRGRVDAALLARWMATPFIHASPPKSTGRELFGEQFIKKTSRGRLKTSSPEDLLATAAEFTAASLVENLRRYVHPSWPIAQIYLAGGGAQNSHLVRRIQALTSERLLPTPRIARLEEVGMPAKARECVAFAVLGYARMLGIPANVPSATGATRPVLLGSITEPSHLRGQPWRELIP